MTRGRRADQTGTPAIVCGTPATGSMAPLPGRKKNMKNKFNPLYWYVRMLDATDEWLRRTEYRGKHWSYQP